MGWEVFSSSVVSPSKSATARFWSVLALMSCGSRSWGSAPLPRWRMPSRLPAVTRVSRGPQPTRKIPAQKNKKTDRHSRI